MGGILRVAVLLGMLWSIGGGPFNILALTAADSPVYFDPDLDAADYWRGMIYAKRSGFWSPHPSDYNPMRRPNHPVLRPASKRDFEDVPYHPLAKGLSYMQRLGEAADYVEAVPEGSDGRTKKHTWPANLVYSLGSGPIAAPRDTNPNQKYVPSGPSNRK